MYNGCNIQLLLKIFPNINNNFKQILYLDLDQDTLIEQLIPPPELQLIVVVLLLEGQV